MTDGRVAVSHLITSPEVHRRTFFANSVADLLTIV
jgi:hypothetical protein